jgi:transposase-like protein
MASGGLGRQRARHPGPESAQTKAAKRFFRKLLKGLHYVPRVIVTDTLKSYGAAKREILPGVEHRQHKGLNNRANFSHQPTRLREKKCGGSNQPNRHSAFSLPLVLSLNISNLEDTV